MLHILSSLVVSVELFIVLSQPGLYLTRALRKAFLRLLCFFLVKCPMAAEYIALLSDTPLVFTGNLFRSFQSNRKKLFVCLKGRANKMGTSKVGAISNARKAPSFLNMPRTYSGQALKTVPIHPKCAFHARFD